MNRAVSCAAWVGIASMVGASHRSAVEWKEGEIWLTRDGAPPVQLTHDGCEKDRQPAWSPDRTKIAYYTNTTVDKLQCPTEVVLLSADGTRVKVIPAVDRGNSVMEIGWLGNDRIGIDTHITPSSGQYRVVDVTTGAELASYFGNAFQPSPDFKHIAHAGGAPHFSPPFAHSDYLMIDDQIVYPLPAAEEPFVRPPDSVDKLLFRDIHEFRPGFAWSLDGTRIAFVERLFDWRADGFGSYSGKEEGKDRWSLVVVPAAGGPPVWTRLPEVRRGDMTIQWAGADSVKLAGGGVSGEYKVIP